MSTHSRENVVQLDAAQLRLRQDFLKWQCAVRKMAVRQAAGRPQSAMCPEVRLPGDESPHGRITTLIVKHEPEASTAEFKHAMRRSVDPLERHDSVVKKLSGTYFEDPEEFSDRMTALFGPAVSLVEDLVAAGECVLEFEQGGQRYTVPSTVEELAEGDPAFEATYWHNSLFNPHMPPGVRVLAFQPDWAHTSADPPPS